ncbi:MAG: LamG domain-containing protein, partial [Planctomycetota bacterium]
IVQVKAWGELPANYALNVCPDANNLSWQAGEYAVDHNVYFGTSMSDVNESASPYLERHGTNSFTASLELGKTYYWRVDEVNDGEVNSPWVGDIWEFTTNDGNASVPYPIDLAVQVDPNVELEWTSGCTAQSHDVYFGTDFGEVEDANSTTHPNVEYDNVTDTNYSPGPLDYSTYYFWRIDEVDDGNTYKGRVWQLKTRAFIPDPNMVVWYKFDETSGGDVMDSSGHEIRGDIYDLRGNTWDPNDGKYPGCIHFHEDERIDLYDDVFDYIGQSISISVWWKDAWREGNDNNRFCGFGDDDLELLVRADSEGEGEGDHGVRWQAGNDTNDRLQWATDGFAWKDEWHHLVFTKNGPEGTMKIYFDTVLVASTTEANGITLGQAAANEEKGFRIGTDRDGGSDFAGKADDFRVYDYEISQSKIDELFRGGDLGVAWAPSPYSGQVDVAYDVELSWKPGDWAADVNGHEVYLGTSFDDVNDANNTWPIGTTVYKGPQDANEYDPVSLEFGTTYFWRIDEVNDVRDPNGWRGPVWSFTTAEYIIIDNFEDDTAQDPPTYDWVNGIVLGTGATLSLRTTPPVIGEHSMRYEYWNFFDYQTGYGYYSETETISLEPNDWNYYDVKTISLWFYGTVGNDATEDATQMNLGLEDDSNYAVVWYGELAEEEITDVQVEEWQRWEILTSRFTNINFSDVKKICIGFGTRGWPTTAGYGVVYFDDIHLYPPSCRPDKNPIEGDFSQNCIIDWADVEIMADDWLMSGVGTVNAEPPDANMLILQYLFDEASGTTVADNSSNGYTGTFFTDVNQTPNDITPRMDPGKSGNSFHFSSPMGKGGISIPNDVFADANMTQEITVSCWIKNAYPWPDTPNEIPEGGAFMWEFRQWDGISTEGGDRVLAVEAEHEDDDNDDTYTFRDDDESVSYDFVWSDHTDWQHYAFVRDANTLKIYVDGLLQEQGNSSGNPIAVPGLLYLGTAADRAPNNPEGLHDVFTGNIDDFRIYKYAVSYAEAVGLAEQASIYEPVDSVANIYEPGGEEIIDLKDFGELAKDWLKVQLWPE